MSRSPLAFRQTDVTRAIKAVQAAGVSVASVEVDKAGKIIVIAGKPSDNVSRPQQNEWDDDAREA